MTHTLPEAAQGSPSGNRGEIREIVPLLVRIPENPDGNPEQTGRRQN